jgi:hypothetical protein
LNPSLSAKFDIKMTQKPANQIFAGFCILFKVSKKPPKREMLGHTNIKTTQHYAKILDLKVGRDMALIRERYPQ